MRDVPEELASHPDRLRASLLPAGFAVLDQHDAPHGRKRLLLARRPG